MSPPLAPSTELVWTSGQLAQMLGAQLVGSADVTLTGIESLERATGESLSFVRDAAFLQRWRNSACGAALVSRRALEGEADPEAPDGRALLIVEDADRALAQMLERLAPPDRVIEGVDERAIIDPSASIAPGVGVAAGVTIGAEVVLEEGAQIHAGCVLGEGVRIGARSRLMPNVVVNRDCEIGAGCLLHPGVIIGADGFGFLPDPSGKGLLKIPHIGNVVIGNDVEIGANSCVDRAKFGSTIVGDGTKIDNLVQIGHGCRIGRACVICGVTGIAGSVVVEDGATIAGCAGIADGLTIGSGAIVAAKAGVMSDVPRGETWFGYPATTATRAMRRVAAMDKVADMLPEIRRIMKDRPASR